MEQIKNKYSMIIARYNENIDWLIPFKDICTIYNKGSNIVDNNNFNIIDLNNYGRESHTYLYHIINNYDNLAEYNIFFQGKINDHDSLRIEEYFAPNDFNGFIKKLDVNILKNPIKHFGKWKNDLVNNNMKKSNDTVYNWLINKLNINLSNVKEISVAWGALFSVSKKIIHQKPKAFYEDLLRYVNYHSNPEEGHFFERSWHTIFHCDTSLKKMIYYTKINNESILSNKKVINKIYNLLLDKNKDVDKNVDNFESMHVWVPYIKKYEYEYINQISSNKYIKLKNIFNNHFEINIKANNKFFIKIIIDDNNYYEMIIDLNKIIINLNKNNIYNQNISILNFLYFINVKIMVDDTKNCIIHINNKEIMKFKNDSFHFNNLHIKCFSSINEIELLKLDNINDNNKIKYFMMENNDQQIDYFYTNNYLNCFVSEIDLLEFII